MDTNLPTEPRAPYAVLRFVPGVDRSEVTVLDTTGRAVASTSYRPTERRPGALVWDDALADLGYARIGDWQPTEGGFWCTVERRSQS